jgi:chromosome segregation ATPase
VCRYGEASLKAAAAAVAAKHAKQLAEAKDLARREADARDTAHALALKKCEEKLANQSAEHKKAKEAAKKQLEEVTGRATAACAQVGALAAEVKALKERVDEGEAATVTVGFTAATAAAAAGAGAARSREKR